MYRFVWLLMMMTLLTMPLQAQANITHLDNIAYVENGHERQRLDVYLPENTAEALPTIFLVHGGGFIFGDEDMLRDVARRYAQLGYAVVVPTYRLAPAFTYPAAHHDVFCAYAWVFAHAGDYAFDTDSLVIIGESAGALVGAMVAIADDPAPFLTDCTWQILTIQPPQAVIALYMPTDLSTCECPFARTSASIYFDIPLSAWDERETRFPHLAQASLFHQLDADDPPFYLIHGDSDGIVPISESDLFAATYQAHGGTVEFISLENVSHGFFATNSHPATQRAYTLIDTWLIRILT